MSNLINFNLSKADFKNRVADRNMHVVRGAIPTGLVSWEDLNKALYCMDASAPSMRLHKGGLVPEDNYIERLTVIGTSVRRVNQAALYEYMRNGATLILNRLDAKFEIISKLCAEVAGYSDSETRANGYIAFAGEGSFGNHWDTHDVMAIQLIGRKRWKVYKPTFEFPLSGQTSKNHKHECCGEPVFDDILEAGDLLYLPRGWWHNALPIGETFHVAIGVHSATVMDYVQWLCQTTLRNHVELRRSVRPRQDMSELVRDAAEVVAQALMDPERQAMYLQALERATSTTYSPFNIRAGDPAADAIKNLKEEFFG